MDFFEGSEKKVEIVVVPSLCLLDVREEFWQSLVGQAKARILSSIATPKIKAFLLSESSLFVMADRIILITCGRTTLVNAALSFIKEFGIDQLANLFFERKNEYFPRQQPSDFFTDVAALRAELDGEAWRFGLNDEHHIHLFHAGRCGDGTDRVQNAQDKTTEILMYGLGPKVSQLFRTPGLNPADIRRATGIDRIFPGFAVDDYCFAPLGYSLNAVRDDFYYTLHVTPQEQGTYVSFETNLSLPGEDILRPVIEIMAPDSFDWMEFHPHKVTPVNPPDYRVRQSTRQQLGCGYDVVFTHFYRPSHTTRSAELLP